MCRAWAHEAAERPPFAEIAAALKATPRVATAAPWSPSGAAGSGQGTTKSMSFWGFGGA